MEVLSFIVLLAGIVCIAYLLNERSRTSKQTAKSEDCSQKEDDATERYLNNFNYLRGKELFDSGDHKQAFEYLNKAIADDSDNGYAHGLIARIYYLHEDYGMALKAFENAINGMPKDKASTLYLARIDCYKAMGKTEEWLADCNMLIEIAPDSVDGYEARAEYYYLQDMHEETIADIDKFIRLDPHNPYGYMVKGRSLMALAKADEALDLYKYAQSLDPKYVPSYSFQVEPLLALDRKNEAVDAEIKAMELSIEDDQPDNKAMHMRDVLAAEVGEVFFLKLKAKIAAGSQAEFWMKNLAKSLAVAKQYSEAACWYEKVYQLTDDLQILYFSACCWRMAGNSKKAETMERKVLAENPDFIVCRKELAGSLLDQGKVQEAIDELDTLIRKNPDEPVWYYHRAKIKEIMACKEEAMKDYQTAYSLDSDHVGAYYRMSRLKAELGLGSNNDLLKIVEAEDLVDRDYYVAIALLQLGRKEEARAFADQLFDKLSEYSSDEAKEMICLELVETYYKMGERDKALNCVDKLLSLGYCRFWQLQNNPHFGDFVKDEKLISLIGSYKQKAEKECGVSLNDILPESGNNPVEVVSSELKATSIPFTRENGICKVPCFVNNLPLHFVFDTGASDVSISSVEANFMLKNGYLSQNDLMGKEYFSTATGEISEGTKIRLEEVNFGGLKLRNVKASVVKNQTAPLLLGQSVLQRLGTIEIDNANSILKVTSERHN